MFKRTPAVRARYVPYDSHERKEGHTPIHDGIHCLACKTFHPQGQCPLKLAGTEMCNLCGIAHFGFNRTCPHLQSEVQVSFDPPLVVIPARRVTDRAHCHRYGRC